MNESEASPELRYEKLLAWAGLGAVFFHGTAMVLLHALVPDVDPMRDMASAYLESQYAWLSRSTFLALGCALAAVGLALRAHLSAGVWVANS